MRLIDADKARAALEQAIRNCDINNVYDRYYCDGLQNAKLCLAQPTIEERKHGHWIFTNAHYYGLDCALYYYKCSICGELVLKDIKYGVGNYCLHCGAVMDEEEKADE